MKINLELDAEDVRWVRETLGKMPPDVFNNVMLMVEEYRRSRGAKKKK